MVETNIIIRNERYKVLVMEDKNGEYSVSLYRWLNISCKLIQKEQAHTLDQASNLIAAFIKSVG